MVNLRSGLICVFTVNFNLQIRGEKKEHNRSKFFVLCHRHGGDLLFSQPNRWVSPKCFSSRCWPRRKRTTPSSLPPWPTIPHLLKISSWSLYIISAARPQSRGSLWDSLDSWAPGKVFVWESHSSYFKLNFPFSIQASDESFEGTWPRIWRSPDVLVPNQNKVSFHLKLFPTN